MLKFVSVIGNYFEWGFGYILFVEYVKNILYVEIIIFNNKEEVFIYFVILIDGILFEIDGKIVIRIYSIGFDLIGFVI